MLRFFCLSGLLFLWCLTLRASFGAEPWRKGYFPDVVLTTQDGKKARFYEDLIQDKVVAISFIYTQCPGPCSAETANLKRVQKILGDQVGKSVHMYSISIDPIHDTPSELKKYAQKFSVQPGWTFLTGKKAEIDLIRKKLGLLSQSGYQEKLEEHSIHFIVGNESIGKWIKRSAFDHPQVLAQLLSVSLQQYPTHRDQQRSYAVAQQYPQISQGEKLYRTRCISCHSLGSEDGIGPGLAGIFQKRDPKWLSRWIREPDRVLAEGDPIALELLSQYKGVAMPNLKLTESEVDALVSFMGAL